MLNKAMIFLLAHYLIYPFYFDGVSNTVQQLIIFGAIFVYAFINFNQIISIFRDMKSSKKSIISLFILYLFIVSASFLIPILNGTNDLSYFSNLIRTSLYTTLYIILLAMVRSKVGNNDIKNKMIEIFVLVTRNYVVITLLFLLFPILKEIWFSLIKIPSNNLSLFDQPQYLGRIGWTGYSGFSNTVHCTIAIVLGIYLLFGYYKKNQKLDMKILLSILFALIGNTFYGRAGLLISLMVIFISIVIFTILYKKINIILYITGGVLIAFTSLYILKEYNASLLEWYNWMMEPLISLVQTGAIETSSTDTLWNMWFIPDVDTVFLGDGYYTNPITGSYYMGTDVGYLRPLLFFGIFFTVVNYSMALLLGYSIAKGTKEDKLLVFLLVISLFVFEIKGEVISMFLPVMVVIFLGHNLKESQHLSNIRYKNHNQLMRVYNYEINVD